MRSESPLRPLGFGLLVVVCAGALARGVGQRETSSTVRGAAAGISDLLKAGVVLQDRNGDGVVDFINARVVLGEQPRHL